jgi:putative transposase
MVLESAKLHSCSIGGKWLYVCLPKIGIIKVRHHRPLPDGTILKQAQIIKKADGWYINLRLQDDSVPELTPDIEPTWDNSLGMDAILHENDYLAPSEGLKLPSLKSFRKSQGKLASVSKRKSARKKGSKQRRKLASRESRLHQQIARARRDHAYNTAHALLNTGKKVFFHEKLNLAGLSRRNKPKTDELGNYLPNGQSAKSGLNQSWADAAMAQFFNILKFKAEKAGALVIPVDSQYTSQLLPYKDEFAFTDCSIREYWDKEFNLLIDRDISAGINIKRVGLGLFPTIKRRKGNPVVVASTTNSTLKEVLSTLRSLEKPALYRLR